MHRIRFINPRTDERFVGIVEAILDEGEATPQELQGRLRESYPDAVVRERDLQGDPAPVLYVYRDGHWVPEP